MVDLTLSPQTPSSSEDGVFSCPENSLTPLTHRGVFEKEEGYLQRTPMTSVDGDHIKHVIGLGTPATLAPRRIELEIDSDDPYLQLLPSPDAILRDDVEEARHIDIDNMLEVPEERIEDLKNTTKSMGNSLSSIMLESGAVNLMAFDEASAFTEAVLQDGLGISGTVDDSILEGLVGLMNLEVLSFYASRTKHMPEDVKTRFLKRFVDGIVPDILDNMRRKAKTARYSQALDDMRAKVKAGPKGIEHPIDDDSHRSSLGAKRSRN